MNRSLCLFQTYISLQNLYLIFYFFKKGVFNSLNFIKSLGYTHFHRIEYDTVLGDLTLDKIKKTSQKVNENGKNYLKNNFNNEYNV